MKLLIYILFYNFNFIKMGKKFINSKGYLVLVILVSLSVSFFSFRDNAEYNSLMTEKY